MLPSVKSTYGVNRAIVSSLADGDKEITKGVPTTVLKTY